MDPALRLRKPRPAAAAGVGFGGAAGGAAVAADRAVAFGLQRVRGQVVAGEVLGEPGRAPMAQGIDLDPRAVAFEERQAGAGGGLEGLAAGDPGLEAGQGLLQRQGLA